MNPTSHPFAPVRHSYPVAAGQAGFWTALGRLVKTLPYALIRFAVLLAVSLATIVWLALTLGAGAWLVAGTSPWLGTICIVTGVGLYGILWRLLLRYVLYLIKAGHIAVLTELITTGSIANGSQGMFSYGRDTVRKRLGEVSLLFSLDLLIHGVVRSFNRGLDWIGSLIPIPGLDTVLAIARAIIFAATTYIDETLFSYNLARGDDNPWRSARDGLIYYCQNAKELLKTAVWVVILDKVLTVLAWVLMLAPAVLLAAILPDSVKIGGSLAALVIAVFLAANIRSAFIKPLFLIMVMTRFHLAVRNQAINETWDSSLAKTSTHYCRLRDRVQPAQ